MKLEKVSKSMRELVSAVAGPRLWNDTRESWLGRAARRAGISFRQCKSAFYEEPVGELVRMKLQEAAIKNGKSEASDLARKYLQIADALNAAGENNDSEMVTTLVNAARILGGVDSTRT